MRKKATTVLVVKKKGQTFLIGDGQVSQGSCVVKANARKVRVIREGIVCGFAGGAADAIALMELLEKELDKYQGFSLLRPCTELAKQWRSNKLLRHLSATMLVADKNDVVEMDGEGNLFEINTIRGIGSGGLFAECRKSFSRRRRGSL
jgi:ATP-dependent HslUV protease subunit HslV